jgi:hypothetical protein
MPRKSTTKSITTANTFSTFTKEEIVDKMRAFLKEESTKRVDTQITPAQLASFMSKYFESKEIFGLGRDRIFKYLVQEHPDMELSRRQVNRILQTFEVTQTIQMQKKKTTDIKKQLQKKPMALIELDLLDNSNQETSSGNTWLMNAIDTFSKYGFSVPLKDKSEKTVIAGFRKMLKQMKDVSGKYPSTILSDNGSEFINSGMQKILKDNDIKHILTKAGNASHAKSVERFNLYIRRAITKYKNQFDDGNWDKYIDLLMNNYNKTISRVTKKPPKEIVGQSSDPDAEDNKQIHENIKKAILPKNNTKELVPYEEGQLVRVKIELESEFEKPSNNLNYTREKFKIIKVKKPKGQSSLQPIYKLENQEGKKIDDDFYHNDLSPINSDVMIDMKVPELFIVQAILKDKMMVDALGRNRKHYLVKWKGYNEATWELASILKADVPKKVKQYEKDKQ